MEPTSRIPHLSLQRMFPPYGNEALKKEIQTLMKETPRSESLTEVSVLNDLGNFSKKYQESDIREAFNTSYPHKHESIQTTLAGLFTRLNWLDAFKFVTNNGADLNDNEAVLRDVFLSFIIVRSDNYAKIFNFLKENPNINWNLPLSSYDGSTILGAIARYSCSDKAKKILEIEDIDPNSAGYSSELPLQAAISKRDDDMVTVLLSSPKTNINQKNNRGQTSIEYALQKAKKHPYYANDYYNLIVSRLLPHPQFDSFTEMSDGRTLLEFAKQNNLKWLSNKLIILQSRQQPAGAELVMTEVGKRLGTDSSLYKQLQELDSRSKSYCAPFLSKLMQRQAELTDDEFITEVNGVLAKISALKTENTITETAKSLPKNSQLRMSLEELEQSQRAYAAQLLDDAFPKRRRINTPRQKLESVVECVLNEVRKIEEGEKKLESATTSNQP